MGIKFSQFINAFDIFDDDYLVGVQTGANKRFTMLRLLQWFKSKITSSDISYDPTISGASATNVKDALDEAFSDLGDKQASITASGILKGDGQGGVTAATAGTDYGTYSKPSGGIPASDLANGVIPTVPSAYTNNPATDGAASPGSSGAWARGDHVHPSDISKTDLTLITQYQESSSTSSRNYKVGEFFVYNGLICRVVSPISAGQAITPGSNIAYNTAMPMFESVTDTTTAGGILALSTVLRGRVILAVTAPGYIAIPWQAATGYWYLNILNPGNMNLVASTSVTASIWYY